MSFFKRNQTYNTQPSHLLTDPIFTNVAQMNDQFLHHHKPLGWQNSQGLWQSAPVAPLATLPLQQSQPYWQSRGLSTRGGPYRQIRLRTKNWGNRSESGWSGFNNSKYQSQTLSNWEPKSFLLSELRAQSLSQRGLAAPFNQDLFWQQWQQQRDYSYQQHWGQQSQQRGLNNGLNNFNNNGFNSGLNSGLNNGFNSGLNNGFNSGLNNGFNSGLNNGLNNNFNRLSLNKNYGAPQQFVQTIMKPAILQETVRTDRVVQVQPILHREVEQNVVNHIQKHITEAPAAPMGGIVRMAPVVQEITQTRVIDEIQPVVHREVAIAQVERVEEHLTEHVVAPTQHTNNVVYEPVAPIAPLSAPIAPLSAPIAPIAAPLSAGSLPLTNTANITKVVPTGVAGSPMLLEKQQQAALAQPIAPTYGAAMM